MRRTFVFLARGEFHIWPWAKSLPDLDVMEHNIHQHLSQRIGLRENLQETIDFPMKYGVFRLNFSLKPIHSLGAVPLCSPTRPLRSCKTQRSVCLCKGRLRRPERCASVPWSPTETIVEVALVTLHQTLHLVSISTILWMSFPLKLSFIVYLYIFHCHV